MPRSLMRLSLTLLLSFVAVAAALQLLEQPTHVAAKPLLMTFTYPGAAPCDTTLQACIDNAADGDVINILAGTYITSVTLDRAVSLIGADSSTTILSALSNQRVITVTGASITNSTVISGLTFANGDASGGTLCPDNCGGGILLTGNAQPLIQNVVISNNLAYRGGGLFADTGSALTLNNVVVINNTANNYGGGLEADSTLSLTSTQFLSNTAGNNGGGVRVLGAATLSGGLFQNNSSSDAGGGLRANSTLTLSGTQFLSNTAVLHGGGISVLDAATLSGGLFQGNTSTSEDGGGLFANDALTLSGTQFLNNMASDGGGLYQSNGNGSLVNALFARNVATSTLGAALYFSSTGNTQILHTTIASPTVSGGSAIFVVTTGTVGISNTIVASHTIGISNSAGTVYQNYNLFFGNTSDLLGAITSGASSLTGNPAFLNPAADDYHLSAASLAVDRGANVGVTTDFEGQVRPQGSGFDIGYDESPFTAVADLSVSKSVTPSSVQPGQAITYTIAYSNNGPQIADNVVITDLVPLTLTNVSYTSSGALITPTAGITYSWQVGTLLPGSGGLITLTGIVNPNLTDTSRFTNTAIITSTTMDSNGANNTSAVGVDTLSPQADLSISKSVTPSSAAPAQAITYTITFNNNGPSTATGVSITDLLPITLTNIISTSSGALITPTASGWQVANLTPGTGGMITITGIVNPGLTSATRFTNTATITSSIFDPNAGNNASAVGVDVVVPGVSFSTATQTVSESVGTVTITVNITPVSALTVTVPYTVGGTATGGGVDHNLSNGSFTLAPGSASASVSFDVLDDIVQEPDETIIVTLGTPTNALLAAPSVQTITILDNDANLAISKTDGLTTTLAGRTITYTIVVTNNGFITVTGASVADVITNALTSVTWTCVASVGSSCAASGSGNINDTVTLAAGGTATYSVRGTVSSSFIGTLSNTATVTAPAGITDPVPGNNSATDTTSVQGVLYLPLIMR